MKKDLLGLKDISAKEIENILETAGTMKLILGQPNKKTPHLQGKTVVNLFYENSTRTRLSFELAAKYMSANAANITASGSSVQKGETLIDTAETINAMGTDILVMRHNYIRNCIDFTFVSKLHTQRKEKEITFSTYILGGK